MDRVLDPDRLARHPVAAVPLGDGAAVAALPLRVGAVPQQVDPTDIQLAGKRHDRAVNLAGRVGLELVPSRSWEVLDVLLLQPVDERLVCVDVVVRRALSHVALRLLGGSRVCDVPADRLELRVDRRSAVAQSRRGASRPDAHHGQSGHEDENCTMNLHDAPLPLFGRLVVFGRQPPPECR